MIGIFNHRKLSFKIITLQFVIYLLNTKTQNLLFAKVFFSDMAAQADAIKAVSCWVLGEGENVRKADFRVAEAEEQNSS